MKCVVRGTLTALLALSAIVGLTALSYAQSATGVIAPEGESSAESPTNMLASPVVFGKFAVIGKGQQTTSVGSCADAQCPFGDSCGACFSWTGLRLTGSFNGTAFGEPTLTGDFTVANSKQTTSGAGLGSCFPAAGHATVSTNASKTNSIQMDLIGQLCGSHPMNPSLQFAGSYLVTGGTGIYSSAAGSGTVTADASNGVPVTRTHTVQMNGTLLR